MILTKEEHMILLVLLDEAIMNAATNIGIGSNKYQELKTLEDKIKFMEVEDGN